MDFDGVAFSHLTEISENGRRHFSGRSNGQVEVTRTPDMISAWGKVKLSDGSASRLTVGKD